MKLKQVLLVLLVLALVPTAVFAGKPYKYYWFQVQDEYSVPRTDWTSVTVYTDATTTAATIYNHAQSGATDTMTNPILVATTSNGIVKWYGNDSTYDLIVTFTEQVVTFGDITVNDHKVMCLDKALPTEIENIAIGANTASTGAFTTLAMGTSGTPLTSSTEENKFFSCYYTATGKNIFGWYLSLSQTYVTDGAPRGLTIRTSLDHASGHGPQGANSVDARVTLGAGNTGISGEMHAMESQLKVDTDTRSVQGTYAAHKFTNYFKTGNTMPATTFFLRFVDQNGGNVATPFMFDFSGITAGASNCIEADSGAVGTVYGYMRVKDPAGATGYIPIYADHS